MIYDDSFCSWFLSVTQSPFPVPGGFLVVDVAAAEV
jgi:hypothetical protein